MSNPPPSAAPGGSRQPAASPYSAPAHGAAAAAGYQRYPAPAYEGDATGGVIPYKNPAALTAYYLGIFSLFPVVGFPLGIASIILGFKGLKARRLQPVIKGKAHALVGIICGFLGMLFHIPFGLGLIVAIFAAIAG